MSDTKAKLAAAFAANDWRRVGEIIGPLGDRETEVALDGIPEHLQQAWEDWMRNDVSILIGRPLKN